MTPEYIEQCKAAVHIQKSNLDEGDYVLLLDEISIVGCSRRRHKEERYIPLLHQLVEMVKDESLLLHHFLSGWKALAGDALTPACKSAEEAMLALVMYVKHGKIWNGKAWVKA